MSTPLSLLVALPLATGFAAQVVPAPRELTASPWPDEVRAERVPMQWVRSDPAFADQALWFVEALGRLGAADPLLVTHHGGRSSSIRFERDALDEGLTYRIRPDRQSLDRPRLIVTAAEPAGAAHAVATLLQLVRIEDGRAFWPALEVADGPDHPYRSFMVDMGRNPHGPATLRRVIDAMAWCKANYLQLHLGDDQLFSWPSKAFPKLLSEGAGWTWDDFVALEAYARARGVTIVPELDVPGHSTILRRTYPDVFGAEPQDLAASPEAQRGLETLIDELLSVFTSTPYVHVGGDEAYSVPEELQRDFINRLDAFVRSRGRRTVVWEGPRLGEGDNKVDERVLHMNWRTINVSAQDMLDAGYEVVNAAWDPLYIVDHYPRTMFTAVDLERCYGWNPRRFAHVNHDIATFAEPHVTDTAEGLLGFCMPWWEGREENLLPLCLPRLTAVASAAWNRAGEDDFEGFLARYEEQLPRLMTLADFELEPLPRADPATQAGNLAFGARVVPSSAAHQPPFGPQRLTNGLTARFDHFLGYPTKPEPLEIVIELAEPATVGRVVVHETAVGGSHELYELEVSDDGAWERVGQTTSESRGEATFVEHVFEPRSVRRIRLLTRGCHGLTFPSFSRLTEVQAFAE